MDFKEVIKQFLRRFSTEGLYFKSKVATVKWNAPRKVAILKWTKRAKGIPFMQACIKNLELTEVHQSKLWYENRVMMPNLKGDEKEWYEEVFMKTLKEKGIHRIAYLLSSKEYQKVKHRQWVYGTNSEGIEFRYFEEVIEAVTWLLELKAPKPL